MIVQCWLSVPCGKPLRVLLWPVRLWDRKKSGVSSLRIKPVRIDIHQLMMVRSVWSPQIDYDEGIKTWIKRLKWVEMA